VSFLIQYEIDPDKAHLIPGLRPLHLAHVEAAAAIINLAGVTRTADDAALERSFFVLNVDDRAAAEAFSNGDPYVTEGIFRARYIARFEKRVGWAE
jgi:uncharacterized protein YciI